MDSRLKLSFVFAISHLAYGGNFCERVQNCLDNLYQYGPKLDAEIVIVELEGAGVYEAIKWHATLPTRIITVPKAVHDGLPNPHGEKFFEYIMKNVGIRRAKGTWIISTNPDNIYSPTLLDTLSEDTFDPNCFYRVNRWDVREGIVFAKNLNTGTYYTNGSSTEGERTNPDPNGLHFNAAGDFLMMRHNAWCIVCGHPESPYSLTVDGETVYAAHELDFKQVILQEPMYHQDHSRTDKYCPSWNDNKPNRGNINGPDWGLRDYKFDERTVPPLPL